MISYVIEFRQAQMKWIMIAVALVIMTLGAVTFWLPIPIGIPLALAGTMLLVRHSSDARRILARLMRRFPRLRRLMLKRKKPRRPSESHEPE